MGETLQSLAEENCPGSRSLQVAEFREGVRDLNYDAIGEGDVWAGLRIVINRWEEKKLSIGELNGLQIFCRLTI